MSEDGNGKKILSKTTYEALVSSVGKFLKESEKARQDADSRPMTTSVISCGGWSND